MIRYAGVFSYNAIKTRFTRTRVDDNDNILWTVLPRIHEYPRQELAQTQVDLRAVQLVLAQPRK